MKSALTAYIQQLNSAQERQVRGFTIARHYYELAEYEKALNYLRLFHKLKSTAQSFKLLGQCEQALKHKDAAIKAYQSSLLHDEKQADVIVEICALLLDSKKFNAQRTNYWLRVAHNEEINSEIVNALQKKYVELSNGERAAESIAFDLNLNLSNLESCTLKQHIRNVMQFHQFHMSLQALFYIFEIELGHDEQITHSSTWIELVLNVLKLCEAQQQFSKNWPYWLLKLTYLERLLSQTNYKEFPKKFIDLLFIFDQALFELDRIADGQLCQPTALAYIFKQHFLAQMLFHVATFFVAREAKQKQPQWQYVLTLILPLLLIAYQLVNIEGIYNWLTKCKGRLQLLVHIWLRASAFRCLQIAHVLRECVNDSNNTSLWSNNKELLEQMKRTCAHAKWRQNLFSLLFLKECYKFATSSSMLLAGKSFKEPRYCLPSPAEQIVYAELAQLHKPHSLDHMVYVATGYEHLYRLQPAFFDCLPFAVPEHATSAATSLCQLDVDCFLYAACIQTKGIMQINNKYLQHFEFLHGVQVTNAQRRWWRIAFEYCEHRNWQQFTAAELANLELGIETIRGVNGPKADMPLIFMLANVLVYRALHAAKPVERALIETRAEHLYSCALNMHKMACANVLEPFGRFFHYAHCDEEQIENAVLNAIAYIAGRRLPKPAECARLMEEMADIQHPLAGYLRFIGGYKTTGSRQCCVSSDNSQCRHMYKNFLGALVRGQATSTSIRRSLFTYFQNAHKHLNQLWLRQIM